MAKVMAKAKAKTNWIRSGSRLAWGEAKEEKEDSAHSASCGTEEARMTIGVNGMEVGGKPARTTVGRA